MAKPAAKFDDLLRVEIEPFGPTARQLAKIGKSLLRHKAVRNMVGRGKHRLLSVEAVDQASEGRKTAKPREPDRFRATIHDYAAARTLLVDGRLDDPSEVAITESGTQPPLTS